MILHSACFRLLLLLLPALLFAVPAFAQVPAGALADTNIQSGDYDRFSIQGPRAATACQAACDRDPRCVAWSYIKTVGQCRLKHTRGVAVQNKCCVAGYKTAAPAANAQYAKQKACADYANAAVQAQEANLQQDCGLTGARWTDAFADHYAWCLRSPLTESENETVIRADEIRRCTQSATRGLEAKCDHYLRSTQVQLATADKAACAVDRKDPRWATDMQTHARACRVAPNRVLQNVLAERELQLATCFESAGKQEAACQDYAVKAVAAFQESLDNGCALGGPRWHASKGRHYQWCLNATTQNRQAETQARRTELARCLQLAAKQQRCNDYSKGAVAAALRNDNIGCKLDGPGVRWSRYQDDHDIFCQTASEQSLANENAARERELSRCQARLTEVNAGCDRYARRSNRLSALNEENDCGGEGKVWSTDLQAHYNYCLGASFEERQDVLQAKRRVVAQCSDRRGFTLQLEF